MQPRHPTFESTAEIYISVLDRTDMGERSLGRRFSGMRACKLTIRPDSRISKYTVYGLKAGAKGSLWPDLVEDSQSIDGENDTPSQGFLVSDIPGQRVQELEQLVLREAAQAGHKVGNSQGWVSLCLNKMCAVGIITGREREDALQRIGRAMHRK